MKKDKEIDFSKPVKTRGGLEVNILADRALGKFPVVGQILDAYPILACWDRTGRCWGNPVSESPSDLVQTPAPIKRTVWLNIYPTCTTAHHSKEEADRYAVGERRLACEQVEIDTYEGAGLEEK